MIVAVRSRLPFERGGLAWRGAPFAVLLALAFGLFLVGSPRDWGYFLAAGVVAVGAFLLAGVMPWERLPQLAAVVPPLLIVAVIALLRQGQGGSVSGYGALFLIPILWAAGYGTRIQLAIVLAALALAYWLPIVIVGGAAYPNSQWRGGALLVLVAGVFGLVVQQLVAGLLAEEARRREAEQRLLEAEAYELHDDVVQNLTVAQLALALEDPARAASAIDRALHVAQAIVRELLDKTRPESEPGSLVRERVES